MTYALARALYIASVIVYVLAGLVCLIMAQVNGPMYLPGLIPLAICAAAAIGIDRFGARVFR